MARRRPKLAPTPADIMLERGRHGLQEAVRRLAIVAGWGRPGGPLYYHTNDSRHSPKGFPDVQLVWMSTGRHVVAELKRETGMPTPEQRLWLDAYLATGAEVYLWRPRHFYSGAIETVLLRPGAVLAAPEKDWGTWPHQGGRKWSG